MNSLNLFIVCLLASQTLAFNILGIFIHPGRSHFEMFLPMMRGLAEKGHNLTVISMFPEKNPPENYQDIALNKMDGLKDGVDLNWFENPKPLTHYLEIFFLSDWGKESCQNALTSPELQAFVTSNTQKFDLVIMEIFNTECPLGIAHKIQAEVPIIALSSCPMMSWHYARTALPHIASYMPVLFSGNSEKMSFVQRLQNWFTIHSHNFLYPLISHGKTNELIAEHLGPGIPPVAELTKQTKMMMVNQHYSLAGPKPLPPSVVEIGGIHIREQKPLEPDLQSFLDNAKEGVVVVSWGSMIRAESMPDYKRDALLWALGKLKQKVIWKWENSTVPNKPHNVHIRQWLPQRDILCHPNVHAFWGHGGLLGSSEAAYCGVPMVITPQYGDQFVNAAAMVHRGMGVLLPFKEINKDTAINALLTVLSKNYKKNAKELSYSFTHRMNSPLETAIFWAEHIAHTGGKFVRSEAADMPWYVYWCLDIWALVIAVTIVISATVVFLVRRVCMRSVDSKKAKSD